MSSKKGVKDVSTAEEPVKRQRGRPRKYPKPDPEAEDEEPTVKRPRGRPKGTTKSSPKKKEVVVATGPKKGRGRPRRWANEEETKSPKKTKNVKPKVSSDEDDEEEEEEEEEQS